MPRPPKCRWVEFLPGVTYFKPAGRPLRALGEVCLSVEEAEAIRLKDLEKLEQEKGAERMHISRPTFQRVLASARQKIADALFAGKAIRIDGGNFEMAPRRFQCFNGHEWAVPFETVESIPPKFCPTCETTIISPLKPSVFGQGGRGSGRQHRRRYER